MRHFNLVDRTSGDPSLTAGRIPRHWQWDRSCADAARPVFYVNDAAFDAPPGRECYAILTEPRSLIGAVYEHFPRIIDRFRAVFTHDSILLAQFPDVCRMIPGGCTWIGGSHGGGEARLYAKTRLVSMVSSTKSLCPLHLFRYQLAQALTHDPAVAVFIARPGAYFKTIETLADFRYSVVVENHQDDYFFTEKLLNCFATGTVPVYLGARKIHEFFDRDGVIPFQSWDELRAILPSLGDQDYQSRRAALQTNLERVRDFDCTEDFMASRYGALWPDAECAANRP